VPQALQRHSPRVDVGTLEFQLFIRFEGS
jgi:hypothetical protein